MKELIFLFGLVFFSVTVNCQDTGGRIFLKDANGMDIRTTNATIENTSYLIHPKYFLWD